MKDLVKIIFFGMSFLFASCTGGLLSSMNRQWKEPVIIAPFVDSFSRENEIEVFWDEDPGADSYVLFRASDSALPAYIEVYKGNALFFQDKGIPTGHRYLYSLGKIRGTKLFGPSEAVLGVGSSTVKDNNEPNDTSQEATELTWDLTSNIFYYSSVLPGISISDTDWYFVNVPPRRQANIVVTQRDLSGEYSYLDMSIESVGITAIKNGVSIGIKNHSHQEESMKFKIIPNPQRFQNDLGLVGGSTEVYDIKVASLTELE